MTDARLKQTVSLEGVTMDLLLRDSGILDEREELATAVRVALGTDALSDPSEVLPDPDSTDRRGWWGDMDAQLIWNGWGIGCRNWLLTRAKITDATSFEGSTLARAETYTRNALQWLIDNRVASRVDVSAAQIDTQRIDVDVTIYRGPEIEIDLRYQLLWQEEAFLEVSEGTLTVVPKPQFFRIPYRGLTLSTTAPVIARTFDSYSPAAAQLVLSSVAPDRVADTKITPPQGDLAVSADAPSAVSTSIFMEVPSRDVAISTTAPTVTRTTNIIGIYPPAGQLALSPNFFTVTRAPAYPTWVWYVIYSVGDVVTYGGQIYRAIAVNSNCVPPNYPLQWVQSG